MSLKEDFQKAYKKATKKDPAKIDRTKPAQVQTFIQNLEKHHLVGLFNEAIDEVTDAPSENDAMVGMANLFDM